MRKQSGFSYVLVMFSVAIMSIISVRALDNALTNERRAKEAELLYVGAAYRSAIESFYNGSPGSGKQYPDALNDLLLDARTTTMRRHLRKLYRDPITGAAEWGLVKNEDGKVMGVYSLSVREPVKTCGFPQELAGLAGAKHYTDWKFVYQPN